MALIKPEYAHSPVYQQGPLGDMIQAPDPFEIVAGGPPGEVVNTSCVKPAALQTQIGGAHYTDMTIQPIEYIQANHIPFPEGNVIKYVSRWRSKGGIKDLRKAAHHLELLIEYEEGLLSSYSA